MGVLVNSPVHCMSAGLGLHLPCEVAPEKDWTLMRGRKG
jgi:hypothetical protein